MEWDLNLCVDWQYKTFVPFHHFVKPWVQSYRTSSSKPFRLLDLPIDIQLMVYEYCDKHELFQLMRMCSQTRCLTTKLFWADTPESPWYHHSEEHSYLFGYGIEHHPILHHCPEFARRITKIEIGAIRFDLYFKGESESSLSQEPVSTVRKAQIFWGKIVKAFPAVKRVVLTGYDWSLGVLGTMETVVKYTPPNILVRICIEHNPKRRPRRYILWQVDDSLSPAWQIVNGNWNPTRVLLPPRRFPDSPLGNFLEMIQGNFALLLEVRGLNWLKIETYTRYAPDAVMHCPRLDCDATFATRKDWKRHLWGFGHLQAGSFSEYDNKEMMKLNCWRDTPGTEQAALEARQRQIDFGYKKTRRLARRVACGWNKEGSEQRRWFEEEFLAQLRDENFVTPGELLKDSINNWIESLRMFFEPTYPYYEETRWEEWADYGRGDY